MCKDEETLSGLVASYTAGLKRAVLRITDSNLGAELGTLVNSDDRKSWFVLLDSRAKWPDPRPLLALVAVHDSVQINYMVCDGINGPVLKDTFGACWGSVVFLCDYGTHWTATARGPARAPGRADDMTAVSPQIIEAPSSEVERDAAVIHSSTRACKDFPSGIEPQRTRSLPVGP